MPLADSLRADLILVNGRVLTMDGRDTEAQALAIKDERLLAVGENREIESLAGPTTRAIDLAGQVVLPGLADIHVHLASDALQADAIEVRDFFDPDMTTIQRIQERIREHATQTPPGEWIVARGSPMQDLRLADGRWPTRDDLDAAAPEHPCYVSFGAHVIVANTLALRARNVTRDTPDPQGGTVVKHPSTGEPTGVLRERAQYLVKSRAAGQQPIETMAENILLDLERAAARGVTTVHDIVVNRDEVRAYQLLEQTGRLPVRVQLIPRVIESNFSKESLLDLGLLQGFGSDWLRLGGIKMSIDGGFTGKNAAFSEPLSYHGNENPGLIRIEQDELDDTVWRYHEMGMRCCVHAIGDVALDMILEAYDKALSRLPRPDHRHRVEHFGNWMFTPERSARAKRLGILPIPNPSMLYFLGGEILETLGPKRAENVFPFRTLLDTGFPLSFGSDAPGYWPVDPLRDLGAAVARTSFDGREMSTNQAISVKEALRAQTATAQWIGFQERKLGTLESGKLADVAVLAVDPMTYPASDFRNLPITLTLAGGKVTHGSLERVAAGVP
jgi:predicted amidohydrolase YtcJ